MTLPNQRHYSPHVQPSKLAHASRMTSMNQAKQYEESTADAILSPVVVAEDVAAAARHLQTDTTWKAIAHVFSYPPGDQNDAIPSPYASPSSVKAGYMAEAFAMLEHAKDPNVLQSRYHQAIDNLFASQQQQQQMRNWNGGRATATWSKKAKKRTNLSTDAKRVLREWFDAHFHHPYPSEEEKERLRHDGGITLDQVNNWFINTRVREWKPKLHQILADSDKGDSSQLDEMLDKVKAPYQTQEFI
ncbi:hypothetical protein AeMF1_009621 [Aphanomyces euteiches]|nr:hypothetical protein AeMF1_009621 [Aphanomyces euteiches]KAH9193706.1 hypothetical protein AeNC1_004320 [Aphanomyces euteiches]